MKTGTDDTQYDNKCALCDDETADHKVPECTERIQEQERLDGISLIWLNDISINSYVI